MGMDGWMGDDEARSSKGEGLGPAELLDWATGDGSSV